MIGTPAYLAPETLEPEVEIDGRADLYSLGCVAFALLTGRPPFRGDSVMSTLYCHVHAPPPALPGVAPGLERLVHGLLAKRPDDRPCDAAAVRAALAALSEPSSAPVGARWAWGVAVLVCAVFGLMGGNRLGAVPAGLDDAAIDVVALPDAAGSPDAVSETRRARGPKPVRCQTLYRSIRAEYVDSAGAVARRGGRWCGRVRRLAAAQRGERCADAALGSVDARALERWARDCVR